MIDTVRIHCLNTGEYKDVPVGSSLEELIDIFGVKKPYLIANARVNNKTEALTYKVYHPRRVEFNDLSDSSAMRTYVRSLCFVLSKAVDDTLHNAKVFIEHAVSRGYYFYIESEEAVGEKELMAIKKRMQEIIDANIPFVQVEEEIDQVVKLFRENGMDDKALLLETSDELLYARYSKLDNYIDYYYGCLLPSTGYLNLFDVVPYNGGYLLVIPNRQNPVELEPVIPQQKLLKVYREHIEFLKISKLDNVGDLNKAIRSNKISEIIQISEAYRRMRLPILPRKVPTGTTTV